MIEGILNTLQGIHECMQNMTIPSGVTELIQLLTDMQAEQ